MVDEIEIRQAVVEDIEGIAASVVDSARYHRDLDPDLYRIPPLADVIRDLRDNWNTSGRTIFVASIGGQVAGSADVAILRPRSRVGMVRPRVVADVGVAVLGRYRRQGVGRRLMQVAEGWAKSQGTQAMRLDCHVTNEAAIALYQSLGYVPTGILMRKPISGDKPSAGE